MLVCLSQHGKNMKVLKSSLDESITNEINKIAHEKSLSVSSVIRMLLKEQINRMVKSSEVVQTPLEITSTTPGTNRGVAYEHIDYLKQVSDLAGVREEADDTGARVVSISIINHFAEPETGNIIKIDPMPEKQMHEAEDQPSITKDAPKSRSFQ